MTFLISAMYAAIALAVAVVLVIVLYFRSMSTSWGKPLVFYDDTKFKKYILATGIAAELLSFSMLFFISSVK